VVKSKLAEIMVIIVVTVAGKIVAVRIAGVVRLARIAKMKMMTIV
jgi:hypothetical protein